MIPTPTSAECRELADDVECSCPCKVREAVYVDCGKCTSCRRAAILRWTADLIDATKKGVTEAVVDEADRAYSETFSALAPHDNIYHECMRAALIAIAPHLAAIHLAQKDNLRSLLGQFVNDPPVHLSAEWFNLCDVARTALAQCVAREG